MPHTTLTVTFRTITSSCNDHIFTRNIRSEAKGSKIGMMKINSYKSNVFLKRNDHIFTRNTAKVQGQQDWYDEDKFIQI